MNIAILAKRHSIHTTRWANTLAKRNHEVHLISSTKQGPDLVAGVMYHPLPVPPPTGFFLNARPLRRLLEQLKPVVLNTHFASGYGTLARLSGFHPNVLSVWGSDVYDFPDKSPIHRKLVCSNLRAADWVCSTSHVMAQRTRQLYPISCLSVIPFGIDASLFSPQARESSAYLTIGTVKTLAHKYGVDLLIKAFAQLRAELQLEQPDVATVLRLLVVGGGPDELSLKRLARNLCVEDVTTFVGAVSHQEVPDYLNQLDIYAALSRLDSESFGVAILEASACALPVVVSDVGGLPEVVKADETGFVVFREDVDAAAAALKRLALSAALRERMGEAGRRHVLSRYTWEQSVVQLEKVYSDAVRMNRE